MIERYIDESEYQKLLQKTENPQYRQNITYFKPTTEDLQASIERQQEEERKKFMLAKLNKSFDYATKRKKAIYFNSQTNAQSKAILPLNQDLELDQAIINLKNTMQKKKNLKLQYDSIEDQTRIYKSIYNYQTPQNHNLYKQQNPDLLSNQRSIIRKLFEKNNYKKITDEAEKPISISNFTKHIELRTNILDFSDIGKELDTKRFARNKNQSYQTQQQTSNRSSSNINQSNHNLRYNENHYSRMQNSKSFDLRQNKSQVDIENLNSKSRVQLGWQQKKEQMNQHKQIVSNYIEINLNQQLQSILAKQLGQACLLIVMRGNKWLRNIIESGVLEKTCQQFLILVTNLSQIHFDWAISRGDPPKDVDSMGREIERMDNEMKRLQQEIEELDRNRFGYLTLILKIWLLEYRLISKKGEGTFSEVLEALSIKTKKKVAIKCQQFERDIGSKKINDEPTGRLALVFELMDMNMYDAIKVTKIDRPHAQKWHFSQRYKTDDKVKLADFGSCRGIYSKQPYTEYISTRWYRAPECLLTDGYYGYKMDLWGVGCVIFEVLCLFPLFPGNDEHDQVIRIHNIMGSPPKELLDKFQKYASHMEFDFPSVPEGTGLQKLMTHVSPEAQDLVIKMLTYNPDNRITASQAVKHPWFKDLRDQEKASNPQIDGNFDDVSGAGDYDLKKAAQARGDKFLKTQKQLPDLKKGSVDPLVKNQTFLSESDDSSLRQLPMIKGNSSNQVNQIQDAYVSKFGNKTLKNGSFNQTKYISNMNGSQSPSQTFYKGKLINSNHKMLQQWRLRKRSKILHLLEPRKLSLLIKVRKSHMQALIIRK
ncbi:protein kinase [Stylonychia lemnae]|uniref:Protein kinase n=1 Tax=Stylonychia lemnae TaxID=5949 RepID=A0A078A7W9_STYLE|nr:protein kinase [Stylonychia lemnae]|eukprot:CDW76861.1 protein kinase [Stylonychia lemnae]